ncbi:NlpC/P60 family protein [Desemzia incerta]|uniref:NlpC/P60 family protein n=1 Tax=Desemzia incerta TaxID=82801 RepID=UPI001660EF92|nr:NlpC/P60 family protein [Desemzia incerta]
MTTANEVYYQYTSPTSESEARPGDLVFFENTYSLNVRFTHIGIYASDGVNIAFSDSILTYDYLFDYVGRAFEIDNYLINEQNKIFAKN